MDFLIENKIVYKVSDAKQLADKIKNGARLNNFDRQSIFAPTNADQFDFISKDTP
jgi:hypothetical protein